MRICLFGTSHLAAPRLAHQSDPDRWGDLDITFVGGTKNRLLDHQIADGVMTPTTPEMVDAFRLMAGVEELDLRSFDAFAIVGGHIGPHMIGHIYGQARWCSLQSVIRKKPEQKAKYELISEVMLDELLSHRLQHTVAGRLGATLRAVSDRPVLVFPAPRPGKELLELKRHNLIALKWAVRKSDARHLSRRFDALATDVYANMGLQYLPQPNRTIEKHVLTRETYILGAIRLTAQGHVPQPDADIMHGNRLYGEVILDQINTALAHVEE